MNLSDLPQAPADGCQSQGEVTLDRLRISNSHNPKLEPKRRAVILLARRVKIASALSAMSLLAALPVTANATTEEHETDRTVTISIQVPNDLSAGQTIPVADLWKYGVPKDQIDKIARGEQPEPASSGSGGNTTGWPDRYNSIEEWKDVDDWASHMRLGWWDGGDRGFGLEKIQQKHDLDTRIAKAVTQKPRGYWVGSPEKYPENGQAYEYFGNFTKIECSPFACLPFPSVTTEEVRVVHDFRRLSDGRPFGIVTAYCVGKEVCPPWVKDSYTP
jgi:hypothetical protein